MIRGVLLSGLLLGALAGGWAAAQGNQAQALVAAKREADEANQRSEQLEAEAARATDDAARARAHSAALAARIEAAESEINAAQARIRIIEALRAAQRACLADRQEPVARLTAALETMARRPPALALVQPGSLSEVVHVRSMLAATLPVIRQRTAALRGEVAAGTALRRQADIAVAALRRSQQDLKVQRVALAKLEADEIRRSQGFAQSAMSQSDRALALGEKARDIGALMDTLDYQAKVRASLAGLPGPALRPGTSDAPPPAAPRYILPVDGRLVTGTGEISDAGVHARGLTFEASPDTEIVAPRAGRVVYAGRFRGYGNILILDHGGGWTSVVTNIGALAAARGETVAMGAPIGRTGPGRPRVTVELRRRGLTVPITPLL